MANRKLQTEIERTLKKVTEGLEIFHETLEKLEGASTAGQKEKIEAELKKEIKKLQRLRDLIKGWQTLSELKDKGPINEARRLIELEMERFKVLEKEMKIKAYSKEGLSQTAKLDPRDQEKLNAAHWINAVVDRLGTQTDALEAELESLQIQSRKSKRLDGSKQERLEILPEMVERHKLHIRRLEQLLRMMENDQVAPEDVNGIKDDVEYYVEANQEPDFVPDESLYDQFELTDESSDDELEKEEHETSPPSSLASSTSHAHPHHHNGNGSNEINGVVSNKISTLDQASPKRKTSTDRQTLNISIPLPSLASIAAATTTAGTSMSSKKVSTTANATTKASSASSAISMPVVLPPAPSHTATATATTQPPTSSAPMAVPKVIGPSFASAIAGSSILAKSSVASSPTAIIRSQSPLSSVAAVVPNNSFGTVITIPGPYEEFFAVIKRRSENQKPIAAKSPSEVMTVLETSWQFCPDGSETERSRTFTPKQPFCVPTYYPPTPPSILENPGIFERFELDTLFFIFYYQQKTYAQYFAARELKRQSWRFHKKYLTWFQRHEEPKSITEEYEQGTYIYFDYEGNWCQRKKSEFTFEYRYLEDEETI